LRQAPRARLAVSAGWEPGFCGAWRPCAVSEKTGRSGVRGDGAR